MSTTTRRIEGADGVKLAVHHLGGDGPPVMLVHATGFHGRCWEPLAEHLVPDYSVWAIDQRGHGASDKAPDGRYDDWDRFVDDLLAVIDGLGLEGPTLGLGHSLGGAVLLMAEARRPGTFSSLCCYEPVVMFSESASAATGPDRVSLADLARKRQQSFPSRQAALDNYRSKPPFRAFHPAALDAYVTHGFIDSPDGTVTLACAREDEASMFEGAPRSRASSILRDVRCPVAVMAGSDPNELLVPIAVEVARHLPRGGLRRFDGLDHFGPMVDPARVAEPVTIAFGARASTIAVTPPG